MKVLVDSEKAIEKNKEEFVNRVKEIVVSRDELVDKVTGYVTNGGKVIYYDQYL